MEIIFRPWTENQFSQLLQPAPAIKSLPDWYKEKSPFIGDEKKPLAFANGLKNISVKWCNPFGDSLGAGYFIFLENDVQVTRENDTHSFVWFRGGDGFISQHSKEQISTDLVPDGFSPEPWKFLNFWGIETPPGYSVLFTHPLNRPELPFVSLSGIVDTDSYHKPVNFPFLIRQDFEGILEAGTPIIQIIPFRREPWKAKIADFDPYKISQADTQFKRKILRPYKFGYWKRKEWK